MVCHRDKEHKQIKHHYIRVSLSVPCRHQPINDFVHQLLRLREKKKKRWSFEL